MRHDDTPEEHLPAGDFTAWLAETQAATRGERGSDVPCDGCTACCTSSQFVHIEPDETDTLAHIPAELLFPAPGRPPGHVLLGYDERGHCPMLIDGQCSIYEHRPRTCRTYDCRVFAAAGIDADDGTGEKVLIARRARRWQFTFHSPSERARHDAVRAAARVLETPPLHQDAGVPSDPTQRAVLAIAIHDVFLRNHDAAGDEAVVDPDPDVVRVEIERRTRRRAHPST